MDKLRTDGATQLLTFYLWVENDNSYRLWATEIKFNLVLVSENNAAHSCISSHPNPDNKTNEVLCRMEFRTQRFAMDCLRIFYSEILGMIKR